MARIAFVGEFHTGDNLLHASSAEIDEYLEGASTVSRQVVHAGLRGLVGTSEHYQREMRGLQTLALAEARGLCRLGVDGTGRDKHPKIKRGLTEDGN